MKHKLFILLISIYVFPSNLLVAQVTDTVVVTHVRKDVRSWKRFDSSQIIAYVNGYKTSIEILGLFKPHEIEMETENSPDMSMEFMINNITVKDTNHLVIRYFKEKARLLYLGQYYDHNIIPEMKMQIIEGLRYYEINDGMGDFESEGLLEVLTYGEEYISNEDHEFRSKPKRLKYYDVDGKIVDEEVLRSYRLKPGEFTSTIISGKEAVEKYKDVKYAEGVVIISISKKKK